jgi:uncharacterized protein (TIGR02145 family)/uncharacterized repeat protein (TIGR02543 family)
VDGDRARDLGFSSTHTHASLGRNYRAFGFSVRCIKNYATYTLDLQVWPEGHGIVTGSGEYAEGTTTTLTATANEGYTFINWTNSGGEEISNQASFVFTIPAKGVTLTANFEETTYTLTIVANPSEGGSVSGGGDFPEGQEVNLSASPGKGYQFINWTGQSGQEVSNQASFVFTIPDFDLSLTAHFEPETEIAEVINPATGSTWMDRNLGATRVATSSTDQEAYGYLYQWGRAADGHQIRTSLTTTTFSSSDIPGHGNFISSIGVDWRIPQNDNLWQGVNGVNNPCPAGYRLPTAAELDAERQSWSNKNASGAFASPLKLPLAGNRRLNGSLSEVGTYGYYWSSCTGAMEEAYSRSLLFGSNDASMSSSARALGRSVRCIKDSGTSEPEIYTLDLQVRPEGYGIVTGSGEYVEGETATITASANQGYQFVDWIGQGGEISNQASFIFTMPGADVTLTANFEVEDDAVTIPLCEALDNCDLEFITGGHAEWFGQDRVTYDGVDAAQSGGITHNQQTWMETSFEGPGELSFRWRVSSESGYDFLEFFINNVRQDRISGNVDWLMKEYVLEVGLNT